MKRSTYLALGLFFVFVGIVGAFLPVLPSTCFFILAAYFFSQSSERLEKWVLEHPVFGPSVRGWRKNHSIPRGGKIAAILGMSLSAVLLVLADPSPWILAASLGALVFSAFYVLTRPTLKTDASVASVHST